MVYTKSNYVYNIKKTVGRCFTVKCIASSISVLHHENVKKFSFSPKVYYIYMYVYMRYIE